MAICGKYYGLIDSFLSDRFQRVLLNGFNSRTRTRGINFKCQTFSDDTSIFLEVRDSSSSSLFLNEDVSKISQWVY